MTTEEKYLAAVEVVNSIPFDGTFEPSEELMLRLYAYEMQASRGPCTDPKPYIWNQPARLKWNAWNDLQDMPQEVAMEKYVTELAKVIETMSYTEKIAHFISLISPFYELVSDEEANNSKKVEEIHHSSESEPSTILENYDSSTILELYNLCNKTKQELLTVNVINDEPEDVKCLHTAGRTYSSSSESSNFDLLSDLSECSTSQETEMANCSVFESQHDVCAKLPVSEKDLIVLTVINLQNAMEDVVKKLDNLNVLAKVPTSEQCQTIQDSLLHGNWGLNVTGAALAILWPIAIEMCFGALEA